MIALRLSFLPDVREFRAYASLFSETSPIVRISIVSRAPNRVNTKSISNPRVIVVPPEVVNKQSDQY